MIELDAIRLLAAATSIARLHQIFANLNNAQNENLIQSSIDFIHPQLENFTIESNKIGAKLSAVAAERLMSNLLNPKVTMTVGQAVACLNEIESRFADHLSGTQFFFLLESERSLGDNAEKLFGIENFSIRFPKSSFEVEEAAKCIAFNRYTASVFHSMRMLEIGIHALSKRLNIDDPVKPSGKNWGIILNLICSKIDVNWPKNSRLDGSEGSQFELLYATLDAVKNPWRNATMHVETIYTPHEAIHILRCSIFFMIKLFSLCDEEGNAMP